MKRIHYLGIVIILLIFLGLFINSPISPINKVSVNGEAIKIASGYTVQNSSGDKLVISNGTNTLDIYPIKGESNNIDEAIELYKEKRNDFNISVTEVPDTDGVYKTVANSEDVTYTITRYWFIKDDQIYNILTENPDDETENVVLNMIKSM